MAAAVAGIVYFSWKLVRLLPVEAASPAQVAAAEKRNLAEDLMVRRLVSAALRRTRLQVRYEATYRAIAYPGGDVPEDTGVCTDEVIRCYRALGYDLQQWVHEDMATAFHLYPTLWNLPSPDSNIDHRRVPNLEVFFALRKASLPVTSHPEDYQPGDLTTYRVEGDRPHIAIVVPSPEPGGRPWIVHNRGFGPKMEDQLFDQVITGHFRWRPWVAEARSTGE